MADTANKQQLWQSRIEECQNSPISAKQWCLEKSVPPALLVVWFCPSRAHCISA